MGDYRPRYRIPALGRELTPAEDLLLTDWAGLDSSGGGDSGKEGGGKEDGGKEGGGKEDGGNGEQPVPAEGPLFVQAEAIRLALFGKAIDSALHRPFEVSEAGAHSRHEYTIQGVLDLTALTFDKPISFAGCIFEEHLILEEARIRSLALDGCRIPRIWAPNIRIDGNWSLNGAVVEDYLFAMDARVDGSLFCTGAQFLGKSKFDDGWAVFLQRARISGSVYFRNGFTSNGVCDLTGATIGGQFDCKGGRFAHGVDEHSETLGADGAPRGDHPRVALDCDALTIGADVFLRDGFHANGMVNFSGASIGGNLDCSGGRFENHGRIALDADSLKAGGDVFLNGGFHATGEVNLNSARIGGALVCDGGRFENTNGWALNAPFVTVEGDIFIRNEFKAIGGVDFVRAKISGNVRLNGASFAETEADAAGRFQGLDLSLATIGGTLYMTGVKDPISRVVLTGAHARAFADDGSAWRKGECGCIRLDGFTYDSIVDDEFGPKPIPTLRGAEDRIAWLKKQPEAMWQHDLRPQPWAQIANVLAAMGHDDRARTILSERAKLRLEHWPWKGYYVQGALARMFSVPSFLFAGHGYFPLRSLAWLFGLWLIGIGIAATAYDKGMIMPVPDRWAQAKALNRDPKPYPSFDACTYAFDITVPVIPVDAKGYWMPNDRDDPWTGQPESGRPAAQNCWIAQAFPWLGAHAQTVWDWTPIPDAFKTGVANAAAAVTPRLSSGSIEVWALFQTLFGWVFATIAVAGLTGLLRRRDE